MSRTSLNESSITSEQIINWKINWEDEHSIQTASETASAHGLLDLVIVATGMLHDHPIMPEKSLGHISSSALQQLFKVNSLTPAIIAKHFLPKLNNKKTSCFAALSARVGSISDNRLGGWYAYRMSKAALNMLIKTASIEIQRRNKHAIIIGLHPGTVDSPLSKPFQTHVPAQKLFDADFSVACLLKVIMDLEPKHTGKCFAWDGQEIHP